MRAVLADRERATERARSGLLPRHARARRKRDALRGREAAREEAEPLAIAQREAELGLRERDDVADEREPRVEHLRRARALRRRIVEEHDALGDDHRAAAP